MQNNELIVLEKANKWRATMLAKRDEKIYPIPAQLRKELDELKKAQIGSLTTQLRFIKTEKYEQFCTAHQKQVEQAKTDALKIIAKLDGKSVQLTTDLKKLMHIYHTEIAKLQEGSEDLILTKGSYEWKNIVSPFEKFEEDDDEDRPITCTHEFRENVFRESVLKKEFDDRYGAGFVEAEKMIVTLEEKFKEALLFGDIELVKDIYFTMKRADEFLAKVQKIEVR